MARGQLSATQCHYVSAGGDEQSSTVGKVQLASVVQGLPVRPIRSFSGQRHYPGLFWSMTTKSHVGYESLLERDRLLLADFDSDVVGIAAQPLWLVGDDNGAARRHVPDLLLARRDGSFVVVDVKPADMLTHPKVSAVFAWTSRVCASQQWRYEVWTGADPIVLANVRQIAAGRRDDFVDTACVAAVRSAVRPGMTFGELESAARRPRWAVRRAMLLLLWRQELRTDLTRSLNSDSIIEAAALP